MARRNCSRRYTHVIFDLDDTLCDYQTAKRNAIAHINKILEDNGMDSQQFWKIYELHEPVLWRKFLDKEISKKEYRIHRYADPLRGMYAFPDTLAYELNKVYMDYANQNIDLFEDVIPVIKILKEKGITPVILTSGPSDGQRDKVSALSLTEHIKHIYISEEIGASKPSPEAFEAVLRDLHLHPDEVLMVGDSVEDDIEGAKKAGLRAILLDRWQKYPGYRGEKIENLLELAALL
jgi:HAD superfamily hydrolase (TIGR01549 family)